MDKKRAFGLPGNRTNIAKYMNTSFCLDLAENRFIRKLHLLRLDLIFSGYNSVLGPKPSTVQLYSLDSASIECCFG